jgi:xanthine dehydrogenase accessory factor
MASAAARLCFLAGFRVLVAELPRPLAVRRLVCFAEAVSAGACSVEGTPGRRVTPDGLGLARPDFVEVVIDPEGVLLARLRPPVLVDGRMAKANLGTTRAQAPLVIGLGPGFEAGRDVHAVVETQRGPSLGRALWTGRAQENTSVPSPVLGVTEARVVRAPCDGVFTGTHAIGALVRAGTVVGAVNGRPVRVEIDGLLRGLAGDGVSVKSGTKVGDVDPRGRAVDPAVVSDKARAVGAGVLEVVLRGGEILK